MRSVKNVSSGSSCTWHLFSKGPGERGVECHCMFWLLYKMLGEIQRLFKSESVLLSGEDNRISVFSI